MHMWLRLSDVQGGTSALFSCRPLLSPCCGLLVGFIPVQDDIIVQAVVEAGGSKKKKKTNKDVARNPVISCLHYSATRQVSCTYILPFPQPMPGLVLGCRRGYTFALADILMCLSVRVCLCMCACVHLFACRGRTWLCVHATLHQQSREGEPEKEKQKQEKHK